MTKKTWIVGSVLMGLGVIGFGIGALLANTSLLAQAADVVLRPTIGGENTLLLESQYFALQDKLNSFTNSVHKTQAPDFATTLPLKNQAALTTHTMDLQPISPLRDFPPIAGEGLWSPMGQTLFPQQVVIARTFIRTDPTHSYSVVSLVKIDMRQFGLGVQAGTYYPGGTHHVYGPGIVPKQIQHGNSLLAVFNGGFQESDGHYGMVIGKTTYVPLQKNLPALVLRTDGSFELVNYTGQVFDSSVAAIRQNGPYLIKDGTIPPFVEQSPDSWGRTTTNSMYTWRSGLGITKNGDLLYAVGNSLVPQTLAQALLKAGAENALQLDINPFWVRFILYQHTGPGTYSFAPLLTSMQNGGYQYLHGYNKDFFYVYKK